MVTRSHDVRKMCIIFPNAVFFFDLYLFLPQEKFTPHSLTHSNSEAKKKDSLGKKYTDITHSLDFHSILDENVTYANFSRKEKNTVHSLD